VGRRCAGILRSGKKIEMEAVFNPAVHPAAYEKRLADLLVGRSKR
jgi:hypothetical protein